ncbi:hypothetical protein LCGC14_2792300, partial [marine sediment metagenome]
MATITKKFRDRITPNQRDQILIAEAQVGKLKDIYGARQASLQSKLARMNLTQFQRYRTEGLLAQIRAEIKFLD